MRLQRKIVKILQKKNWNKEFPTRDEFEEDIVKRILLRVNYWHVRQTSFKSRIHFVLGDMIPQHVRGAGEGYRIDYDFDGEEITRKEMLVVTKDGRDYLECWGGLENFLKRRRRTTSAIHERFLSGIISGIVSAFIIGATWIFYHYLWPLIVSNLQ